MSEETTVSTSTTAVNEKDEQSLLPPSKQHPLERTWSLWFHNPENKTTATNYFHNLSRVYSVSTVEQFWGLFNHVMAPSKLGIGCTYYMFREEIKPEWENKACENGGEWILCLTTKQKDDMDSYWMNAVLACIGESFDQEVADEICGCSVAVRKTQLRISLWIASCETTIAMKLGEQFRETVLLLNEISDEEKKQVESLQFVFKPFADQMKGVRDPLLSIPPKSEASTSTKRRFGSKQY